MENLSYVKINDIEFQPARPERDRDRERNRERQIDRQRDRERQRERQN